MGLFDTDASSTPSATDASGLPSGLLDPSLQKYIANQTLLGAAQGLLNASGPSPVKQSPLGVLAGGAVGGAQAGQNALPDALKLQNTLLQRRGAQAIYSSLRSSGLPDGVARAAALNPDVLKAVAPDLAPKLQDIGADPVTGQHTFARYNPLTNTMQPVNSGGVSPQIAGAVSTSQLPTTTPATPPQANALPQPISGAVPKPSAPDAPVNETPTVDYTAPTPSLATFQSAVAQGVKGQNLYQYLPATMRAPVQAMIEGREPTPTGQSMRSPMAVALVSAATSIDPNFNAANWNTRLQMRQQYASSQNNTAGGQINAGNTALEHLGDLTDAIKQLPDNYGSGIPGVSYGVNKVTNLASEGSGNQTSQAVQRLDAVRNLYVGERSKFYKAAKRRTQIKRPVQNFSIPQRANKNCSPQQIRKRMLFVPKVARSKTLGATR
ncbi:MAG: hypothetical protein WA728_18110 [Xanthobacteraceae bacterium]